MSLGSKKGGFDQEEEDIVAEINMTPLIDIMLVLLIIFMVTSSISLESGLDIDIPSTSGQTNKELPKESVIISLSQMGQISVDGQAVSKESLKIAVENALKSNNSQTVIFEGDKASTLESTIEIMDIAKSAGATKFALAADGQN